MVIAVEEGGKQAFQQYPLALLRLFLTPAPVRPSPHLYHLELQLRHPLRHLLENMLQPLLQHLPLWLRLLSPLLQLQLPRLQPLPVSLCLFMACTLIDRRAASAPAITVPLFLFLSLLSLSLSLPLLTPAAATLMTAGAPA